jgi:hypothetical protein
MLYRVHLAWTVFELTTLVVISTDYIGSCRSNHHTITTIIWLSNISLLSVSDEGYCRNPLCELRLISTFLLYKIMTWCSLQQGRCWPSLMWRSLFHSEVKYLQHHIISLRGKDWQQKIFKPATFYWSTCTKRIRGQVNVLYRLSSLHALLYFYWFL